MKKMQTFKILALFFFVMFSFMIGDQNALASDNPVKDGKYRIENEKGEVLQDENGRIAWSKWTGEKSQVWEVVYHSSSYLNPAGYHISSGKNSNNYIYWDRKSNGKGKTVLVGSLNSNNQYTKNWFINRIGNSSAYSIKNAHYPNPYLSNNSSSITSNQSSSSFRFNSDLTPPQSKSFSLIFTSDPQYPWTDKTDSGEYEDQSTKEKRSEQMIKEQYYDINSYTNSTSNISNIMINGDITAYGHIWQWEKMNSLMALLNRPYYMGLGNHDIENNQDDSFNDSSFLCSLSNLNYFKLKSNIPINDISFGRSSQNYAVELPGNIFALQLNNDPTMDYISTWDKTRGIVPNLDWIENQLRYAYDKGYNIIINVHKPNNWKYGPNELFKTMLKKYNVKAVFAGHYHYNIGKQTQYKDYFGDVPVYLSGSSSQKKYLITEYTDSEMKIYTVTDNKWNNSKTLNSTISFSK